MIAPLWRSLLLLLVLVLVLGSLQGFKVPFHFQVELNGYIQLSLVPMFGIDLGTKDLRLSDINMLTRFASGGQRSYKYFLISEFLCGHSVRCTIRIPKQPEENAKRAGTAVGQPS
ncbi:hypothetical protein J3459_012261 [Metarhizium acridum]|nr:hypothetical protein J3459_012261 [Metarhizium acridum]